MPEYQLTDSIITQLNAQEPWPDNVKLFQPYEVEQILLPDNASCLAVQAFLKMCNLPFEVEMRWNAEFMSPSGRVPFIKCGAFVVSELEPIVQFAANKGITLCAKLSTEEKAEMRAYMSLITNVLVNAELYISWVDNDTFNAVTKARNSSVYPWPLGWLQTRAKRNAVIKRLKALHWYEKTLDQVLSDVEQCCNSLSQRLGDKDYFFGNSPTPLDARLFGHMRAILSGQGPKAPLMIKTLTSTLLHHFLRMINVTDMKMTPQEEYLIYQAFRVSVPRFPAERTISERSTRIRSILSIKNTSRDSILSRDKDALAFKPFASKQMIIMASKEGAVTCTTSKNDKDPYRFMIEICNEIFDKVDDIISNDYSERNDYDEHNDFVVIAYPKENIDLKVSDLHTIAENDVSDVYSSEGTIEEKSATIRRDEDDIYEFHEDKKRSFSPYKKIDSSNANYSRLDKDSLNLTCGSPDRMSECEEVNEPTMLLDASGSKCTLKMPSNEEMSVQSLLNYLRKQNTPYNYIADID